MFRIRDRSDFYATIVAFVHVIGNFARLVCRWVSKFGINGVRSSPWMFFVSGRFCVSGSWISSDPTCPPCHTFRDFRYVPRLMIHMWLNDGYFCMLGSFAFGMDCVLDVSREVLSPNGSLGLAHS